MIDGVSSALRSSEAPICRWYDEDVPGSTCGKPATHYLCNNSGERPHNACRAHMCRCEQAFEQRTNEANPIAELFARCERAQANWLGVTCSLHTGHDGPCACSIDAVIAVDHRSKEAPPPSLTSSLLELVEEWETQAGVDDNGFNYRRGNNLFNEGAASVHREHAKAIRELLGEQRMQEAPTAGPWRVGGTGPERVMVERIVDRRRTDGSGSTTGADVICDVLPTAARDGRRECTALENAERIADALNATESCSNKATATACVIHFRRCTTCEQKETLNGHAHCRGGGAHQWSYEQATFTLPDEQHRSDTPTAEPCAKCEATSKALFALDNAVVQAEDPKDLYDEVRETIARLRQP